MARDNGGEPDTKVDRAETRTRKGYQKRARPQCTQNKERKREKQDQPEGKEQTTTTTARAQGKEKANMAETGMGIYKDTGVERGKGFTVREGQEKLRV